MDNTFIDNEKKQLITAMPYKVTSANADMHLRLRLGALTNLLIQSAIASADKLQAGFGELKQQKLFWVLSRMTIEISQPLTLSQTGEVETWPKDVEKILYLRDFVVKTQEQQIIAKATSGWLAVDMENKRPRTLEGDYSNVFSKLKDFHALQSQPEKLFAVKEGDISEVKATYFDIDLNGHVTASRYIDWMMDTLPVDFHCNHYPKTLSINYLNETLINETIRLTKATNDGKNFLFEGFNKDRNITAFRGKIGF
jgi:acyl-ACP thioesterase